MIYLSKSNRQMCSRKRFCTNSVSSLCFRLDFDYVLAVQDKFIKEWSEIESTLIAFLRFQYSVYAIDVHCCCVLLYKSVKVEDL